MAKIELNKQTMMGLFIVFLMVFSTIGFVYVGFTGDDQQTQYDYNNYKFEILNNQWKLDYNKNELFYYYHPTQLADILYPADIGPSISNANVVYLTFVPETDLEYIDVARIQINNALTLKNKLPQQGIADFNLNYNLPLIDCANQTDPVIKIIPTNKTTEIKQDANCITIEASKDGIIKLAEKLSYNILGVMNG